MAIIRTGGLIGVCIHHSAVKPAAKNLTELKARAKSYNTTHSTKSWAETIKTKAEFGYPYIEYHYMIAYDGALLQVQDEKYVLYHAGDSFRGNLSFNLHGIAILIDGNYEEEKPNEKQMLTLVKLIRDIQTRYKIDAMVRGHKETSKTATACPGKNIGIHTSGWMKQVITNVNDDTYPREPVIPPELIECRKEVDRLKGINTQLTEALGASEKQEQVALERADFLEGTLAVREQEIIDLETACDILKGERDRLEQEKLDLQLKLDKLNQPHWTETLRNRLIELWEEYKDKIISFIKGK